MRKRKFTSKTNSPAKQSKISAKNDGKEKASKIDSWQTWLKYEKVPGNGHCLFTAVGLYLGEDQAFLRLIVAAHIEQHLNQFAQFLVLPSGKTIKDYLQDVRKGQEWADHLEIEVLMRVLDRPIMVIDPDENLRNPQDINRFKGDPIFVYYNDRDHYDALLLREGTNGRDILKIMTDPNRFVPQVENRVDPLEVPPTEFSEDPFPLSEHKDNNDQLDYSDISDEDEEPLVFKKQKLENSPGYVANIPMHVGIDTDISSSEDESIPNSGKFKKSDFREPFPYELNDQERGVIGKKIYLPDNDEAAKRSKKPRIKPFAKIFATEAMADPRETKQRLTLNIGLNRMKSISQKRNKALQRAVNETVNSKLDVRYFGFFWKPHWYKVDPKTKQKTPVKLSEVRSYYQELKKVNPELAKKFLEKNESKSKDESIEESELRKKSDIDFNRMVPYCEIRELIKNHTNTKNLIAELRERLPNSEIYLAVMDADIQSLKTKDCHTFDYYDETIVKHKNPLHMLTSGYTVNDDYPMMTLAVVLDMAVRHAMGSVFPLAPYYPEPNFLILVEKDQVTVTESFWQADKYLDYKSPQESVTMINNVLKNRNLDPNKSLFWGYKAPVMIAASERFFCANKKSKYKKQYTGYYNPQHKIVCWTEEDLTNLFYTAQSHVKPKTWYDSIFKVIPKVSVSKITIQSKEYSVKGKQHLFLKSLLSRLYRSFNPFEIAKYRQRHPELTENGQFIPFSAQLHDVIKHYNEVAPVIIPDEDNKERNSSEELWAAIDGISSIEQLEIVINSFVNDETLTKKLTLAAKASGEAIRHCLKKNLSLNYIELAESNGHAYFKSMQCYDAEDELKSKLAKVKFEVIKDYQLEGKWLEEAGKSISVTRKVAHVLFTNIERQLRYLREDIFKLMVKIYTDIRSGYLEKINLADKNFDIIQFKSIADKCFISIMHSYTRDYVDELESLTSEQLDVKIRMQDGPWPHIFSEKLNIYDYFSYSALKKIIKDFFKSLPIINSQLNKLNCSVLHNTLLVSNSKSQTVEGQPVKSEMLKKINPALSRLLRREVRDIYGTFPLHWAAISGNKLIIKKLLSMNTTEKTHWYADITKEADNNILPLHCALQFCIANGSDPELISLLCNKQIVNQKAKDGRTSLLIAIIELTSPKSVLEELQDYLLEKASPEELENPLLAAIKYLNPVVKILCEEFEAWPIELQQELYSLIEKASPEELANPLLAAIKYSNNPQLVKEFVKHGIDPNESGVLLMHRHGKEIEFQTYPILEAIRNNHEAVIDFLLQLEVELTGIFDDDGNPPLFIAMEHSILEIMKKLIEAGADVNECETLEDTSLLHEAIKPGFYSGLYNDGASDEDTLKFLLNCENIEINVIDGGGMTPLALAAESNNKDAALILLRAGADKDYLDAEGKCLLEELLYEGVSAAEESDDSSETSESSDEDSEKSSSSNDISVDSSAESNDSSAESEQSDSENLEEMDRDSSLSM